MRTEEIKIFKFEELEDSAKEKARSWYREGGLDYPWWDHNYESFETLCEFFGIELSRKRGGKSPEIYFNGFYCQGSGSSFDGSVDMKKMFACIETGSWKEEFPTLELRFMDLKDKNERRIRKAIMDGLIDCSAGISCSNRETSVRANLDWDTTDCSGMKDRSNIDSYLEAFEEYLQDVADELNNHLFRSLEKEYEWLNSDEQVDESIISNEYEFTEDGERY